jgi:hypothetical protein
VYIAVTSARPRDCWRRMRHCIASLVGMTRVMSIPAAIQVCCTEWKPCQGLDGFLKDLSIKMSWNQNGQHLRRFVTFWYCKISGTSTGRYPKGNIIQKSVSVKNKGSFCYMEMRLEFSQEIPKKLVHICHTPQSYILEVHKLLNFWKHIFVLSLLL